MEIDRVNYAKLVLACLSYYKLDETISILSGGVGLCGERVQNISYVCDVARAFSIYANQDDEKDDDLFLRFKAVIEADCSLANKVDALIGVKSKHSPTETEIEDLSMKYLEMLHKQIM